MKVKIGTHQAPRDDNHRWTVELARIEARRLLGQMAAGVNPNAEPEAAIAPSGPTVREGVETHLAKLRKKERSERSIATFVHETNKYLADWLDRPFAKLTGES